MFKHIALQAIFQTTVLLILIFVGEKFIPEYPDAYDQIINDNLQAKYYQGIVGGTVRSGRLYYISGGYDY
jgi:hypothetical protein